MSFFSKTSCASAARSGRRARLKRTWRIPACLMSSTTKLKKMRGPGTVHRQDTRAAGIEHAVEDVTTLPLISKAKQATLKVLSSHHEGSRPTTGAIGVTGAIATD